MTGYVTAAISLIACCLSGALVKRVAGSFISPLGLWFVYNAILIYPGLIALFVLGLGGGGIINATNVVPTSQTVILASCLLGCVPVGALLTNIALRFSPGKELRLFEAKPLQRPSMLTAKVRILKIMVFLGLVGVGVIYLKAGVPALSSDPTGAYMAIMQDASLRWIFTLFAQFLFPLYLLYAVVLRRSVKLDIWILCSLCAVSLMSRRYPIFDALAIVLVGLKHGGFKFATVRRQLTVLAVCSAALIVGVTYMRSKSNFLRDSGRRLLLSQSTAIPLTMQGWQFEEPAWGETYKDSVVALITHSAPKEDLGKDLFRQRYSGITSDMSTDGYLPPTLIGETFINFHLLSVLVLVGIGAVAQGIYIAFLRGDKGQVAMCALSVFGAYFGRSAILGLAGAVMNYGYFLIVLSAVVVVFELYTPRKPWGRTRMETGLD